MRGFRREVFLLTTNHPSGEGRVSERKIVYLELIRKVPKQRRPMRAATGGVGDPYRRHVGQDRTRCRGITALVL